MDGYTAGPVGHVYNIFVVLIGAAALFAMAVVAMTAAAFVLIKIFGLLGW